MLRHLLLLHLSLLSLLNLHHAPFLVAAQKLDGGSSCPITGPFSASETCVVCQDKAACARETGQFDAICYKGVEFSSLAQVKAYRCNFKAPQEFADDVQPGAFIQCDISSNTSQAAGDSELGASCTFGLVAAGDPIVCTATQCTAQSNTTVLECQASSCDCSLTTGCTSEFATSLVDSLSGPLSWGCEVPPGGRTSLTNPTNCTWKAAGLPGGSAQAICDVGECHLPDAESDYSDYDVLTKFKGSFANGEEVLADWGNSSSDPCQWDSVSCNSTGWVVQLSLGGKGLEGSLPPSDTLPRGLLELNLTENSIIGSIPIEWKLPHGLRQLLLAGNGLNGTIPTVWLLSLPSNLSALDLAGNQLNGSLTTAWQLPADLEILSVADNQLTGSIPAGWALPISLNRLSLRGNNLTGEAVPEGLMLPRSLELLEFDVNQLGGDFVEMAARLPPQLKQLSLSNNSINGTLPSEWNLPRELERVDLSANLLSGSIPSTWEPPPSLATLDLHNNRLNGTLPSWPELANLSATVAPNPGLCGAVPPTPEYTVWDGGADEQSAVAPLQNLPDCKTGAAPSDSAPSGSGGGGSNSTAIIVGAVAGVCAVLAVAVGVVLWRRSRQQRLKGTDIEEPGKEGQEMDYGSSTPSRRSSAHTSVAGLGRGSGPKLAGSAEEEPVEEPGRSASSRRSTLVNGRTSAPELEGSGVAEGEEAVVALPGQTRPGWGVSEMRLKVSRVPIQPSPFQNFTPLLTDQEEEEQLDTPSAASPAGARGSTQPSSLSSSGASKELLASDPLLSSIMVRLKTGAAGNPWIGSGSSSASAEQHLSGSSFSMRSKPGELGAAEKGLVVGGQHKRIAGSGSSTNSQRQLVDVGIWHLDFMDLHLIRQIGSGSFGRVYLAAWRETLVAVKLLMGEAATIGNTDEAADAVLSVSDPLLNNLKKEASLMAASRHPNVLGFMGLCTTPPCLISEYCHRGSLYDTLKSAKQLTSRALELTWSIRLQMVNGAALGMLYLHSFKPPIVHRDLKSNNLLIASNWTVKVADFNLSKIMELGGAESSAVASSAASDVGNPRWLAPEVIAGKPHTFASDVFSFGIIMWECLTWEVPWASVNFWQVTTNVQRGLRPPIPSPEELPGAERGFVGLDRYVALLKRCWAQRPEDRPTFGEIVAELRRIQEVHKAELA